MWPAGSLARLVTAVGPVSVEGPELDAEMARARELHVPPAEHLRAAGLDVSSVFRAEDPRKLLLDEAERWGADCVFLGATGLLTLERFLFGTVVAAVVTRVHCSVETLRASHPAPASGP
jgi:nucleotide-binding universal stress UspA family protein